MDTLREMEVVRRSGTGLVALTLWACAAPMAAAQSPAPCAALTGLAIPAAAIGLPTSGGTVTSAVVVPASATVAEHCLVNAGILPVDPAAPRILFRVALPTAWNG